MRFRLGRLCIDFSCSLSLLPQERPGTDSGALPPTDALPVRRTILIPVDGRQAEIVSYHLPAGVVESTLAEIAAIYLNRVIDGRYFWAFSQPDGYVYCWVECVFNTLMRAAALQRLTGWPFNGKWQDAQARSLMFSFYDGLREQGVAVPELIGEDYYANGFSFTNPLSRLASGVSKCFYLPIKAGAFGISIERLEEERLWDSVLSRISILPGKE